MRPAVVLAILVLALLATALIKREQDSNFDARFENTQERIRALAEDIDNDLNEADES